jgi:hypothetical protein
MATRPCARYFFQTREDLRRQSTFFPRWQRVPNVSLRLPEIQNVSLSSSISWDLRTWRVPVGILKQAPMLPTTPPLSSSRPVGTSHSAIDTAPQFAIS